MEIPKSIQYEFFLIFAGIIPLVFFGWISLFHKDKIEVIIANDVMFVTIALLIGFGVALCIVGFYELTNNYLRKRDLQIKRDLLKERELDDKIKLLPKEYRERIFPEKKKRRRKTKTST